MANKLQKLLYNMSAFAPYIFFWNIWDWWQNEMPIDWRIYSIFINGILCIWFCVFFINSCEKKIPKEKILIENCCPNSKKAIDIAIELVPIIIASWNIYVGFLLYGIIIIFTTLSNMNVVSPLLFIMKPHLYDVKPSEGVEGYLLASNKAINNTKQIVEIKEIFKYFLID